MWDVNFYYRTVFHSDLGVKLRRDAPEYKLTFDMGTSCGPSTLGIDAVELAQAIAPLTLAGGDMAADMREAVEVPADIDRCDDKR